MVIHGLQLLLVIISWDSIHCASIDNGSSIKAVLKEYEANETVSCIVLRKIALDIKTIFGQLYYR